MMSSRKQNPFSTTKAVDLSDEQINSYWVDLAHPDGFVELLRPTSPMPMFVLGGKGSGKTHLMRYFSCRLQRLRWNSGSSKGVAEDGYLGVYFRCSGLNASRFSGKGISEEVWQGIFAYYFELSLARLLIKALEIASILPAAWEETEACFVEQARSLFDRPEVVTGGSLKDLDASLQGLQRAVDIATNNCGITGTLEIETCVTPGRLIFGIPKLCRSLVPELRAACFLYLVDEFENLSVNFQRYIQTLLREKEPPACFKIGARLYGLRTFETLSAGEVNKEGAEFETILLEETLRQRKSFHDFAQRMVGRRLAALGIFAHGLEEALTTADYLNDLFESTPQSRFSKLETTFAIPDSESSISKPLSKLRAQLLTALKIGGRSSEISTGKIQEILTCLQTHQYPLLEKVNILMLYRAWSRGKDLSAAARSIAEQCREHIGGGKAGEYKSICDHFKADLIAQLRREYSRDQAYFGFTTFIDMALGSPRNLLMILKNIVDWAIFLGEDPFQGSPISLRAQTEGVLKSVEWFYGTCQVHGKEGAVVESAIGKLGTFLRQFRFSDKPSECSCTAFSVSKESLQSDTRRVLDLAVQHSFLLNVGTQRDRNTGRIDGKFQLNPMLCPKWDLAIFRRGVIAFRPEEVEAIFSPNSSRSGLQRLERRIRELNAPFAGGAREGQGRLFD